MSKKRTLENQIVSSLKDKIAFSQSKHLDKQNLKWGESNYKIYSYSTYNTYKKECLQFVKYLTNEKNINKYISIEESEKYVKDYLDYCKDKNCSLYTLKMRRSALSMLYNHSIDYKLDSRHYTDVTRSRKEVEADKHYSREGKYKDLFTILECTGGRRADIKNIKISDFFEKDNNLYCKINRSKGGRDRIVYVLNSTDIKEIIEKRKQENKEYLVDKIPRKIDVHSYRRYYCKELYKTVLENKELREELLKMYPSRSENVKRDYYKDRENNVFDRDCVYICTQNLGHNRLNVTVNHYLS